MGLFGYGKRDFEKNKELFRSRLFNYITETKLHGNSRGFCDIAVKVCSCLDMMTYPASAKGSELAKIDKRISDLIDEIGLALQKGKVQRACLYASEVLRAVEDSRRFGREADSPSELQFRKSAVDTRCDIYEVIDERAELQKKIETLESRLQNVGGSSAEAIVQEIGILISEAEMLDRKLEILNKRYAAYMGIDIENDDPFGISETSNK